MNLAQMSLRNRSLVALLVVGLTLWGLYNYSTMSRREDPEIKISVALVITIWPGKGAEDVERLVTRKLEDEIEKMGSLKEMKSITRENLSLIFVDINFEADTDLEWQKLRNRIEEARPNLPSGIIGPTVMDDFGDVTAMVWSMRSKTASPKELKYWADQLKARLKELPSVGKVALLGEQEEVIYIEGPMESFSLYGFSPLMAARILDAHNVNLPAGTLRTAGQNLRLDASGSFSLLDEIRNAVLDVSTASGAPLKVRDVFDVRQAYREPPRAKMLTAGDLAVGLDVRMASGHNIVAMGEDVKAAVNEFRPLVPPGIELELLHDQPREVDEFIGTFMNNLIQGLAIVILVILVMGIRPAMIVAVSLPLSIVATLALMPAFNVNLEQVSIAAFIIALGMLVDNAIIVVDNVAAHMERGEHPLKAAADGTNELRVSILTGTLATVFAFLPLRLLENEIGAYVRSLPIVITISMLASFALAMTVTPTIAAAILRPPKTPRTDSERRQRPGFRMYAWALRGGMRLRWLVLTAAVAAMVGAVMLVPSVGLSFFPEVDRDQFTIDIWMPEGTGVEGSEAMVRQVEEYLKQEPRIRSWTSFVGEGGPRFHITVMPQFATLNYARILVNTHEATGTRALVAELRELFRTEIAGARISPKAILLGIPVEAPIAIKIKGPDLDVARRISHEIQALLRGTPGSDMVRDDIGQEIHSLKVRIDSEAAAMAGISNTEVALALLTANEGLPVTEFRDGDEKVAIVMRAVEEDRKAFRSLESVWVPSMATGAKVPLRALATVEPQWGAGVINRMNNQRTVTVLSDVSGRLASDVLRDAWPKIQGLELPPGFSLSSEGEEKERNKAFGELLVIFAIIVGALLLMLTIQFRSIRQALAVLFSVPLAVIGAILGLWISGNSFSFMAFLGVVSLAGMVIKNAVVWVEFVDKAVAEGHSFRDALVDAGSRRLRPIMLTAMTTVGGLLPLGLFGGVLWEGMAWAMIFGLSLATVLTLYVIPVLFYTLFRRDYDRPSGPSENSPPLDLAVS